MAKLYRICSLLMASLFLASASVQFNDSDWYFWVPLYSCAAYVNLINSLASSVPTKRVSVTGKITLYLGIFLLTKVVLEDYFGDMVGIWSLDMRHRLVREKFGSGLVISSMILQLLSLEEDPTKRGNFTVRPHVESGMVILVGISYGLSFVFMVVHEKEMMF
ncbi:uncharacterized protein [Spinacia oleracea]|uniref:Transmembrane protein 220 n=1 Tax=Spinacia oleracea TaxID=3562 RepID=A0A9R0IGR6_SPIOL|nr:uncharacterized protein LOC110787499 [Spinacia oleracea]